MSTPQHVLFLLDHPTIEEVTSNSLNWSSVSHSKFKMRVFRSSTQTPSLIPLNYSNTLFTYLSPTREDLHTHLSKKRVEGWNIIPWLPDTYISPTLLPHLLRIKSLIDSTQYPLVVVGGKYTFYLLTGIGTLNACKAKTDGTNTYGSLWKYRSSLEHTKWESKSAIFPILTPTHSWKLPKDKDYLSTTDINKIPLLYNSLLQNIDIFAPFNITVGDTYEVSKYELNKILNTLNNEVTWIAVDIETNLNVIDTICFATSGTTAYVQGFYNLIEDTPLLDWLSLPVVDQGKRICLFYKPQEIEITHLCIKILSHPNIRIIGQNWQYDSFWIYDNWKTLCLSSFDTMTAAHCLFNTRAKSLSHLASIYVLNYNNWKDRIREDSPTRRVYCGQDGCYTFAVYLAQLGIIATRPPAFQAFHTLQQTHTQEVYFHINNETLPVDVDLFNETKQTFTTILASAENTFERMLGAKFNVHSFRDVATLCADLLNMEAVVDRKTKRPSWGRDALLQQLDRYPQYSSILPALIEARSIHVFINNFFNTRLTPEGHWAKGQGFNGTVSYRSNCRGNPKNYGGNAQQLPSKGKIPLTYTNAALDLEEESPTDDTFLNLTSVDKFRYEGQIVLPNIKKMFIAPSDHYYINADYGAVDVCNVIFESKCQFLYDILIDPTKDLYSIVASMYFNRTIVKKDKERQVAKQIVHGSHYGAGVSTLAAGAHWTIPEVTKLQHWYFQPSQAGAVKQWHNRVAQEIITKGVLMNKHGAMGWFLDSDNPMQLSMALAWLGSSPVNITLTKSKYKLMIGERERKNKGLPYITPVLSVHDSILVKAHITDLTAGDRLAHYMECPSTLPFEVPYSIDLEAGWNYGEMMSLQDFISTQLV